MRPLVQGFEGHQFVALHHIPRNIRVAGIGRIRDDGPAVGIRLVLRFAHAVVIVALAADHRGAKIFDCLFAALADGFMNEDNAVTAEGSGPPGDRTAVIAVRCAGYRQFCGVRRKGLVVRPGDACLRGRPAEHPPDSIGPAQRLETSKAEPVGFILVGKHGHACLLRNSGK